MDIKQQQDIEFQHTQLLDSIIILQKQLKEKNIVKEQILQIFEEQEDLVNNIQKHNKYNNPRLNEKYSIENSKLQELKDKLLNINNDMQVLVDEIKEKTELSNEIIDN